MAGESGPARKLGTDKRRRVASAQREQLESYRRSRGPIAGRISVLGKSFHPEIRENGFVVQLLFTHETLAAELGVAKKTFINRKPSLFALGMPRPLALGGNDVWLRADIEKWLQRVAVEQAEAASRAAADKATQEAIQEAAQAALGAQGSQPTAEQQKRGRGRPRKLLAVAQTGGAA